MPSTIMQNNPDKQPVPIAQASQPTPSDLFRRYWLVILASRWLVINTAAIALTAGILYAFRATPIYEANGQIQINPESGGLLGPQNSISLLGRDTEYLQTQYRILNSRTLLEKVVNKLRLDEDPRYREQPDRPQALSKDIKITPVRLTRLIMISCQHPDPTRAKEIVNAVMDLFMSDNQTQKSQLASESVRQLKVEVQQTEKELTKLSQDMQDYRVKNDAASLDDRVNMIAASLMRARDLVEVRGVSAREASQLAQEAEAWDKDGKPMANFPAIAQDMEVARAKATLGDHQSQFASITNRYGPKHPQFQSMLGSIESDQSRLRAETTRAFQALRAKANLEKSNLDNARTNLLEAEAGVKKLNELRVGYEVLFRKRERAEAMYQILLGKQKEFGLSANELVQNMRVVDYAQVPPLPVKPRKPLILGGSMVLGVLLGCGLAFFLSYLDDSVKTMDDVESFVGCRFLGYVSHMDVDSPVERDLLAFINPTSPLAEMFRSLRATIQLSADSDKLKLLAVTSTVAGEGKSLVASNYAIVTAQAGARTLIIDADLRRPSLHQAFEVGNEKGLSTWLLGKMDDPEALITPSRVPQLDLITCGPVPKTPAELLVSARLVRLLEWASGKYDRIVVDCPPVSVVSDPLVIAARCDAVLFVTRFNKVRREHVKRSAGKFTNAGIPILGICINDLRFETADAYYYAYERYGYFYSAYYKSSSKEPNSAEPSSTAAPDKSAKDKDASKKA